MLQQAKRKKQKEIMYSLWKTPKEAMGVTAALLGFGACLQQEVFWDVPRGTYRNKGYKVRGR